MKQNFISIYFRIGVNIDADLQIYKSDLKCLRYAAKKKFPQIDKKKTVNFGASE